MKKLILLMVVSLNVMADQHCTTQCYDYGYGEHCDTYCNEY